MPKKISLLLADVDGTLVTEQKILTDRAKAAVAKLKEKGIRFAITSGRPPRGMAMLIAPLAIDTPIAGFNGGLFVDAKLKILEEKVLAEDVARNAVDLIRKHELDAWIYRGNDWFVTKKDAPHVAREAWTVKFDPTVVDDFESRFDRVAKIVGITDDRDRMESCDTDAHKAFGQDATVNQSQPYYLDVTHKDANKGAVVDYLSQHLGIPPDEIATIGDQRNDVLMFKRSGLSIAMGNASDAVKADAKEVTDSYNDEGFAKAVERFILGS